METLKLVWEFYFSLPLLFSSSLCFLSYYLMRKGDRRSQLLDKFPCVRRLPILGGLWLLMKHPTPEGVRDAFRYATEKLGRKWVLWMSHKPLVVLADASSAQKILSSSSCLEKGDEYDKFKWLFGNGLITAPGNIWKEDRKLLSPSFKYQSFDGFLSVFNKNANILVGILSNTFQDGKGVNIHPLICRASMDAITANALGQDSDFQTVWEENSLFMSAVHTALDIFRTKVVRPYLTIPGVKHILGIPKKEKFCQEMFTKYVEYSRGEREKILKEKKEIGGLETEASLPFIDCLLSSPKSVDVTGHIITIFSAGFETTASTINYTLFILALHPEVLSKVQEEIYEIFEDDIERGVNMEDLSRMKYLEMCVKETLRLFPAIPALIRKPDADIELEDGLLLPKGTDTMILINELHRDPSHFPDPEAFNPERFSPENAVKINPYAYIPFSMGARNCIGLRYAWMQMKTTLAHILRNFNIATNQKREDIRLVYGMVLEPSPPIQIALKPRFNQLRNFLKSDGKRHRLPWELKC